MAAAGIYYIQSCTIIPCYLQRLTNARLSAIIGYDAYHAVTLVGVDAIVKSKHPYAVFASLIANLCDFDFVSPLGLMETPICKCLFLLLLANKKLKWRQKRNIS